ncbi:selenium metabolism membrane protein YedE/FdhT [Helicobacter cholecystus]|uniref:selenium metabolism membrane protein YedE/FdhT n=1 Tax=Helicobacter cholecystus TaxID=45498 RepID=UPI0027383EFA|nr:selenium metabolism membrane protein YedE/FdhT [Helicobacter cholecystus]
MWKHFKETYLIKFWNPFYSILFLAVLSTYFFGITGKHWAVTGEFTRWGGGILELFGVDVKNWEYFHIIGFKGHWWERVDGIMLMMMFVGAFIATLFASRFHLTMPANKIRMIQALIGGIISGFGARLGMGCNLASFFTGIPQFSLHAWFFTFMSIIGIYTGIKIIQMPFLQSRAKLVKGAYKGQPQKNKDTFIWGVLLLIISLGTIVWLMQSDSFGEKKSVLGIAGLFGLAFGFVIAKGQVCFTSAFRDLFLLGRGMVAKAIVLGMFISTLGIFAFIMLGVHPKVTWVGLNVIIGGFLFGLGITLAGGCECGWLYRATRGQMQYIIVGVGNLIGSVILAYTWKFYDKALATSFPKINLLESFGNYGGLLINYTLLMVLLLIILLIEKRVQAKIRQGVF